MQAMSYSQRIVYLMHAAVCGSPDRPNAGAYAFLMRTSNGNCLLSLDHLPHGAATTNDPSLRTRLCRRASRNCIEHFAGSAHLGSRCAAASIHPSACRRRKLRRRDGFVGF